MPVVVAIHNRTKGSTKFLAKDNGYMCDVDDLQQAHLYEALYQAHDAVREFLASPNIHMGKRETLDPVITNIANLVPGIYNEVDFQFYELGLHHKGTIIAAIDESLPVPRAQIIS